MIDNDFCIIHGYVLEYDFRSGFTYCPRCEEVQEVSRFYNDRDDSPDTAERLKNDIS